MRQKGMVLDFFIFFSHLLAISSFSLSPVFLLLLFAPNTISGECESLRTCFLTTLNQGIRAGGGIGEYMRPSDPFGGNSIQGGDVKQDTYRYWLFRLMFDLGYFFNFPG